jgi:AraC-like DNA-binding protein
MSKSTPTGLENVATTTYQDPLAIAEAYSRLAPLQGFQSLVAERHCLHRMGAVQINRISLTSSMATPHRIAIGDSGDLHLLVCFNGHNHTQCSRQAISCHSGGVALLPVGGFLGEGAHHLAVLRFKPTALAAAGAAMAGVEGWSSGQSKAFTRFTPCSLPADAPQARALHSLVRSLDHCLGINAGLAIQLGLDDVILRSVAAWLMPTVLGDKQQGNRAATACTRRSGEPFDALIDYIRANLHQPLRLSDLEARSNYSRRALQYAFRQRLGTTPKQWIREQRLRQAMAQLGEQTRRLRVREVALACGYRHLGHFSSDFRKLYGCSPREVRPRG